MLVTKYDTGPLKESFIPAISVFYICVIFRNNSYWLCVAIVHFGTSVVASEVEIYLKAGHLTPSLIHMDTVSDDKGLISIYGI